MSERLSAISASSNATVGVVSAAKPFILPRRPKSAGRCVGARPALGPGWGPVGPWGRGGEGRAGRDGGNGWAGRGPDGFLSPDVQSGSPPLRAAPIHYVYRKPNEARRCTHSAAAPATPCQADARPRRKPETAEPGPEGETQRGQAPARFVFGFSGASRPTTALIWRMKCESLRFF